MGVSAPNSGRSWFQRMFLYSRLSFSFAPLQEVRYASHACSKVISVSYSTRASFASRLKSLGSLPFSLLQVLIRSHSSLACFRDHFPEPFP